MDYYNTKFREEIAAHLYLSTKLEEVAKEILKRNINVDQHVANSYGFNLSTLSKKIWIKMQREEFYREKYKYGLAIREIFQGNFVYVAARKYGIDRENLYKELDITREQGLENYAYDKIVNPNNQIFTYLQEESLLDHLQNWNRIELGKICTCQICALEKLSTLAYEFAQSKNIHCPSDWIEHNRADVNWLIEFEMRYSVEIYVAFKPCCWKDRFGLLNSSEILQ